MPDITVYYATNRNLIAARPVTFGERFQEIGPHYIRYGSAVVATSGAQAKRTYKLKGISLAEEEIPSREEATRSDRKATLGSNEIFEEIREHMDCDGMDTLCLIHGYAADFETALLRGAELKDKWGAGRNMNIFVFSWPANGSVRPFTDYHDDRDDARASGVAIARSFLRLVDFLKELGQARHCEQSIHLVAHSMGNWALRHALQELRQKFGDRLPRLLDHVFLMAADEDNDAFEHAEKLALLPDLAKAVHVYFSEDDKALVISDLTKRNPDRLGATGPRTKDSLSHKINPIDCRQVDVVPPRRLSADEIARSLSQHQYYRLREEVIADVRQILAGKLPGEVTGRKYIPEDRAFLIKAKRAKATKRPRGRRKAR